MFCCRAQRADHCLRKSLEHALGVDVGIEISFTPGIEGLNHLQWRDFCRLLPTMSRHLSVLRVEGEDQTAGTDGRGEVLDERLIDLALRKQS